MRQMIYSMREFKVLAVLFCVANGNLPSVEWHGSMYNYSHIQYIYALIVTNWYAFVVASAAAAKWTAFIIQAHLWVLLVLKQKSQKHIAHRMCVHFAFSKQVCKLGQLFHSHGFGFRVVGVRQSNSDSILRILKLYSY